MRRKNKQLLLLLETWQTLLARKNTLAWLTSMVCSQCCCCDCNYQSTEMCWTLTPHHVDTLHDFKWKTIRSFCCCNFPSNIPQTIIWISFLNRSESLRMQWSSKDTFILDIETWCTHFIGLYIATWYFKCSLSAHRFDLIAKAVCAIVLDQKSFMQSMSYARERTLFPWHFHWHKFSR